MLKITAHIKKYFSRLEETMGKSYYHDPIMIGLMTVFALSLIALLFLLIFQVRPEDAQAPLLYNILYGVTYSASWYGIYGYLGALVVLGLLNFLVAWAFFDKERLISYLICCITIFIAILMIIYTYNLTVLLK